ncbi:thioester domain-containing protein [Streptomonospora sp. S1-112]|uniref:Thioester domain-containing protein n=1 Tax=Streptomonospora mangrovi TaxID=2883123 RepID=A0A9X3NHF2_9ACTN|nr:thioester domain-containing protein [Streptomonospora mangrovi]MDA0563080.1 thioester domain-containing protein [Streptomonospora mangrovi]
MTIHPHSATRRTRVVTKFAATAAAAALAFGVSTMPAYADGAIGNYEGNGENGLKVQTTKGEVGTTLFDLVLEDGTVLKTYCIDFETNIRKAEYQEDDWETYPGKGEFSQPAKVHWILQNSYPQVDVATLAQQSGVAGLNQKQALAGTQAAIWHFSNGIELKDGNNANVQALYDYLVENAVDEPQTAEPNISLSISPASAEGTAGETIGEFTVETTAESVPLTLEGPEGVELVDLETGEPVESVGNGGTFGIAVPEGTEPGSATVSASVSTEVHAGRLFRGTGNKPTQTLITAEKGEVSVDAGVSVNWTAGSQPSPSPSPSPSETPSPTPSDTPSPSPSETPSPSPSETPDDQAPPEDEDEGGLPVTGAAIGGLVAAAVAALGTGGAAMYLSRKRRSSSADSAE